MTLSAGLPGPGLRIVAEWPGENGPIYRLLLEGREERDLDFLKKTGKKAAYIDAWGNPVETSPPLRDFPAILSRVKSAIIRYNRIPQGPVSLPRHPRPVIMGVLNVTPDSFSDGGCWLDTDKAIEHGLDLVSKGAHVLDIGGESTRPGAKEVNADEETARVIPVIEGLRNTTDAVISIDTKKAVVAGRALDAGADWVNDVSAMTADAEMLPLCLKRNCPIVLMHMRGTPETMQENVHYDDVTGQVYASLHDKVETALAGGIDEDRLIIDPGIGFGKRPEDNLALLNRLSQFRTLGLPILVGTSRKSFIGATLGKDVDQRLFGTAATVAAAILAGARIVRVHDPEPMFDAALQAAAIAQENLTCFNNEEA